MVHLKGWLLKCAENSVTSDLATWDNRPFMDILVLKSAVFEKINQFGIVSLIYFKILSSTVADVSH